MKLKKLFVAGMAFLTLVTTFASAAQAATSSDVQKVIDESYVQPDYVMGYSLSEEERNQTLNLLSYDSSKDTNVKILTTTDYANIMKVADDSSLQLYSSVKIAKLGAKETLSVEIVTPQNITKITPDMYRNAATTLGIEHAKITVAAPIPVTGESALAGIYYSLEQNGAKVSDESKELAQEELKTLSQINDENSGKSNYDADKLNVAMTDIKTAVADKGNKLTDDQAKTIVQRTINNYNLNLSDTQINLLVNFALNLSKSSIIDSASFKSSLSSLKASIVSKAGNTFSGINLNFDANQTLENSKNIFAQIWQAIVNFFTGLSR